MESGNPQNKVKPAVPPKPSIRGPRPVFAQRGPATSPKPTALPAPSVSKSSTPKHAGDGHTALPASSLLHEGSVEHAVGAAGQGESVQNKNGVNSVHCRTGSGTEAGAELGSSETAAGADNAEKNIMISGVDTRSDQVSLSDHTLHDEMQNNDVENNNNIKVDLSSGLTSQQLISSCADVSENISSAPASAADSSSQSDGLSLPNSNELSEGNVEEKQVLPIPTRCNANDVSKCYANDGSTSAEVHSRPVPKKRLAVKKAEERTDSHKSEICCRPNEPKRSSGHDVTEELDKKMESNAMSVVYPAHDNGQDELVPLRPPRRPKQMRKSYFKCRSSGNLTVNNGDQNYPSQTASNEIFDHDECVAESQNVSVLISPPRTSAGGPAMPKPTKLMKNSKSDSQVNRLAANISGIVDLRLREQFNSPGRPKPPLKPKPDKVSIKSPVQDKSALESGETTSNVDASQSLQDSEDVEAKDVIMPMPLKGVRVLPTSRVTTSESNLSKQTESDEYGHMWLASEGSNISLSSQVNDAMSQSMVEHSDGKTVGKEVRCQSMVFESDTKETRPLFLRTQSEQVISYPPNLPQRKAPAPPRNANKPKGPPLQRPSVPPPNAPPLLVPLSKKGGGDSSDDKAIVSPPRPKDDSAMDINQPFRESIYDDEGYLRPKSSEVTADDVYSYAHLPGQVASPDSEAIHPPPPPVHPRPAKRPRSLSATPVLCEVPEARTETESTSGGNSRDSHGSDKRSSFMGHFYEMIRSKSLKTKRKNDEPSTKSVFYCETDEASASQESQTTVATSSAESSQYSLNGFAPPLPARNSKPNSNAVPVPLERSASVGSPSGVRELIQTQLPDMPECAMSPERESGVLPRQVIDVSMEHLLDTPVVAPGDDDYDDAAAPGIEPYAATDIINNPAIDASVLDDVSLDVAIPVPSGAMKKRKVNHGYVGEGDNSEEDECPYDDTPGDGDAVRNRFSTHTYEATSDMDSSSDSEADSDGYIYPDAQNQPHTAAVVAAGRTEAPCAPAPPTPRHRDVPAPPPLPRRSTSIQPEQPSLPQRSTSLQSQQPELTPVTNLSDKRSTMGHEYSEPKDPYCDSSDTDSDIYDDTYHEADCVMPITKKTSPEYQVYDASCSEARDMGTSETTDQDSSSPAIALKDDRSDDLPSESASQEIPIMNAAGERPESWASSGSDHLTVTTTLKPSRWSGSSIVSGSSCGPSLSDHSDADFEDIDESLMEPRSMSTMRKDESKEKQAKRKTKAFHIVKEIMTTEESFINDLNTLKEFREAILQSFQNRPELIQHEVKQMFKYLLELQRVNEDLLKDISERLKTWESNPAVADIFVKKGPFLKLYTAYIREFESSTGAFEEARKKYPEFDKFSLQFEELHCKKLALKHFMLKPIQRIPQYRLLLLDYLNQLMEDTDEYAQTKTALAILNEVAEHANESAKYRDNLKKLQEIQGSLMGDFEVIKPGRSFIKEGILQKLSRKVLQPRMFFLLNDVLLITSHAAGFYKLKNVIPLTDLKVSLPTKEDFQNEFNMISTQRSFTVATSTPEERDAWLNAIQDAVQDDSSKRHTFVNRTSFAPNMTLSLDEISQCVDDIDFKLGCEAPVWVPDARVSMCMLCTAEFTIAFRRHHCRACGKIVCGHCSDYKAPLKYLGYKAARVCSICYKTLRNEVKDGLPLPTGAMSRFKWSQTNSRKSKVKRPAVLHEVKANDEDAEMSGYLKVWKGNKWKKKWFVLKNKALFTFKASEDAAAVGSLVLLGYEIRTFTTWFEGIEPRLVFEIAHAGTTEITFRTESESSRNKWIAALRQAILP